MHSGNLRMALMASLRTLAFTLFGVGVAIAGSGGPSAQQVLNGAESQASMQHKRILVIFGASWCGWCKQLDAFLNTPDIRAILDRNFVIVHLTVEERGRMTSLNTPGGQSVMVALGGPRDRSLPFYAVLTSDGRLIANSNRPAPLCQAGLSNIGFPATLQDLTWFLMMLKKGAPIFTTTDQRVVTAEFQRQNPKVKFSQNAAEHEDFSSGPLDGTWSCSAQLGGTAKVHFILALQQHQEKVSGTLSSCYGDFPIDSGRFKGGKLTLRTQDGSSLIGKLQRSTLAGITSNGKFRCSRASK